MDWMRALSRCVVAALAAFLLGTGAFAQEAPKFSSFLEDYTQLKPQKSPGLVYNYSYVRSGVDWKMYSGILIEEIEVYLQQLEKIKKQYSEESNYVEADKINEKIKQIKATLNIKKKKNLQNQHSNEGNLLEENFAKEMEAHNANFEQKMKDFEDYSKRADNDINSRHKGEMEALAKHLEETATANIKYPPEYLNLRKSEQNLAQQQRFKEAEFVKQKRLALEKETVKRFAEHKNDKFKGKLEKLAHKQLLEKQALRKKIETTLEQIEKEKKQGEDNLMRIYNGRRQVLSNQQHQEKILNENENLLKKRVASGKYPRKAGHLMKTTDAFVNSNANNNNKKDQNDDVQEIEHNEKDFAKGEEGGNHQDEKVQNQEENHEQIQQEF